MTRSALGVLALAAACARHTPLPSPASTARPGELIVTLAWTAPVDLDLYVTDPTLESVYFGNPRSRSGGVLEHDSRCVDGPATAHVERIRWTAPAAGRYRVGVDYPEACTRAAREVPYRLVIEADGRRDETTGVARLAEREPAVREVAVAGGPPR